MRHSTESPLPNQAKSETRFPRIPRGWRARSWRGGTPRILPEAARGRNRARRTVVGPDGFLRGGIVAGGSHLCDATGSGARGGDGEEEGEAFHLCGLRGLCVRGQGDEGERGLGGPWGRWGRGFAGRAALPTRSVSGRIQLIGVSIRCVRFVPWFVTVRRESGGPYPLDAVSRQNVHGFRKRCGKCCQCGCVASSSVAGCQCGARAARARALSIRRFCFRPFAKCAGRVTPRSALDHRSAPRSDRRSAGRASRRSARSGSMR